MNYGLGTRSKSQDAIRHRKTVRFVSDILGNSVEDLTSADGGRRPSRGRSLFLFSMLSADQQSSTGRLRGSKVITFFKKNLRFLKSFVCMFSNSIR